MAHTKPYNSEKSPPPSQPSVLCDTANIW